LTTRWPRCRPRWWGRRANRAFQQTLRKRYSLMTVAPVRTPESAQGQLSIPLPICALRQWPVPAHLPGYGRTDETGRWSAKPWALAHQRAHNAMWGTGVSLDPGNP
jgi:hypothetical protein